MTRARSSLLLALVLVAHAATAPAQARPPAGTVYTVNYPLHYLASAIAGDDLAVVFPAPGDVDPAFWEPDVDALLAYQRADRVLLNGAGYANWLGRVALPRSRLVDTSAAFADRLIAEAPAGTPHVHGPEGAHVHEADAAFTTWLDLSLARAQAQAVHAALAARWPGLADAMAVRHAALERSLADLDETLQDAAARHAGTPVLASHPVYPYLARRYGLDIRSLHWEPGVHPDDGEWRAFEALRAAHPATVMLWEDEPMPDTRARLAVSGVAVVVLPPLGNRPPAGDFESVLRAAAAALAAAAR